MFLYYGTDPVSNKRRSSGAPKFWCTAIVSVIVDKHEFQKKKTPIVELSVDEIIEGFVAVR